MAVEEFRKLAQRYSHRLILLWGLVMMGGLGMLHYRYKKGEKYAYNREELMPSADFAGKALHLLHKYRFDETTDQRQLQTRPPK